MEHIIIYNSQIENIFNRSGYRQGLTIVNNCGIEHYVSCYWFKGNTVICISRMDDIIREVRYCNSGTRSSYLSTRYDTFLEKLKEEIGKEHIFSPSILNTFNNVLFSDYEPNPNKLDKVLYQMPRFDKDFLALFQKEIDELTSANTQLATAPKQFDLYRDQRTGKLSYIRETFETTVLLGEVSDVNICSKVLDLRELHNNYTKSEIPYELSKLVLNTLGCMHDIVNKDELIARLRQAGYTEIPSVESVDDAYHFDPTPLPIYLRGIGDSPTGNITSGDYMLDVSTEFTLEGYCHLQKTAPNNIVTMSESITQFIAPDRFLLFATSFLAHFLEEMSFVLATLPDIRTYLHQLLIALDAVEKNNDPNVASVTAWKELPQKTLGSGLLRMFFKK